MENEGYRGWRFSINSKLKDPSPPLMSLNNTTLWPSSTLTAICDHGCTDVGYCLENHKCSCGVYSLNSLGAVVSQYSYAIDIYGIVYNHGVVVEGQQGFKAERSTIRCLYTADIKIGQQLSKLYPDVSIMLPPPVVMAAQRMLQQEAWKPYRQRDYAKVYAQKLARQAQRLAWFEAAKVKYPGGPEAEKQRLLLLLRNARRASIQQFCSKYGVGIEWADRNWVWHPGGSGKAKAGDMVFETNNTDRPLVYISSCRNKSDSASIRWCMDRNGVLVRITMFERWDANPDLVVARSLAIQEWK